jgi:hypothetical protein
MDKLSCRHASAQWMQRRTSYILFHRFFYFYFLFLKMMRNPPRYVENYG